jgi:adenylate cyclase
LSLFKELKRRNVLRVGAAYTVAAWLIVQVVETLFPIYGLSDAAIRLVVTVLAIGLLPVVVLAWALKRVQVPTRHMRSFCGQMVWKW